MKKLFISVALLCLVVSVSSCSADDHYTENLNTNEFQSSGTPGQPSPIENGDKDDNKDGDDKD